MFARSRRQGPFTSSARRPAARRSGPSGRHGVSAPRPSRKLRPLAVSNNLRMISLSNGNVLPGEWVQGLPRGMASGAQHARDTPGGTRRRLPRRRHAPSLAQLTPFVQAAPNSGWLAGGDRDRVQRAVRSSRPVPQSDLSHTAGRRVLAHRHHVPAHGLRSNWAHPATRQHAPKTNAPGGTVASFDVFVAATAPAALNETSSPSSRVKRRDRRARHLVGYAT